MAQRRENRPLFDPRAQAARPRAQAAPATARPPTQAAPATARPATQVARVTALAGALAAALAGGCSKKEPSAPPDTGVQALERAPVRYDRISRADFNRVAAELALPLFWVQDENADGVLAPAELSTYWGLKKTSRNEWIAGNEFSPAFATAYESVVNVHKNGHLKVDDAAEAKRRIAVRKELAQGRQTIVETTFAQASDEDKAVVAHILTAAEIIERIYAQQRGVLGMDAEIPADDPSSRMLFHRNQGPWCEAPETENDPDCSALPSRPKAISGLYPASIQKDDPKFCEKLAARKDADVLLSPFVVVREGPGGELVAVPYHEAYKADMEAVSKSLRAAADAIGSTEEMVFKSYLLAASQAFLDNQWQPADEAWSKMNAQNSKWYLRIAPDETYFEPCSRKAGFHVSFARINKASLEWQNKLDPVKNQMESALAAAAGKPYVARKVSFHLPDFIDIIVNAGDARDPTGSTIGQSLPNWGPVANEGRGRTVAMTNFYTDADSKDALRAQVESLFCASSMTTWTDDYAPQLMDTVLHEASHNLGPSHEYKVKGKTDDQIFGGPLASMLEEFKAQTGALFFTDWLVEKKLLDEALAQQAHTRSVAWAFGHISRGMYNEQGKPKPYSQLAAIQLGFLIKEGAATWKPEELAANKEDKGCLALDIPKFAPAVQKLAGVAAGVKARGDKKLAESLVAEFVDGAPAKALLGTITERWLRSPKASFVYGVEL